MENPMNRTYRASELIQTSVALSSLRVRALWRNMRMNSLNSFPERLTMLKTNFVVSEQIFVTMPCTYRMMSSEPLERPRLRGLMDHPQEGKRVAMPFILCFY